MRIAVIGNTGNPKLDGCFIDWVPDPEGDAYLVEGQDHRLGRDELLELFRRGYATPLAGNEAVDAVRGGSTDDDAALASIYAAAAAPAETVRAMRERRDLRPDRGRGHWRSWGRWAALAGILLLLAAAWRFWPLLPAAWRGGIDSLLRTYVLG